VFPEGGAGVAVVGGGGGAVVVVTGRVVVVVVGAAVVVVGAAVVVVVDAVVGAAVSISTGMAIAIVVGGSVGAGAGAVAVTSSAEDRSGRFSSTTIGSASMLMPTATVARRRSIDAHQVGASAPARRCFGRAGTGTVGRKRRRRYEARASAATRAQHS
jgi:hypothetical protein